MGYADGTLALYDLQSESPILVHKIGDVSIFYPYYDERPHNTCVTGKMLIFKSLRFYGHC